MGSSRLPGKVLLPFGQSTLLDWIIKRLIKLPWNLVVATTNLDHDNVIVDYCKQLKVTSFTGKEEDVLDRYYQCALKFNFNNIVRLSR